MLGQILLLKGEPAAALVEFERVDAEDPDRFMGMALALYDLDRQAEFEETFHHLRVILGEPLSVATVYAYVGDVDAAFEWLDRVLEDESRRDPVSTGTNPLFANLHDDPRWQVFLRRMGIAPEQLEALDFHITLPF